MCRVAFALSVSLLCFAALAADDAPKRKSGLWHITMSGAHTPRMLLEECVDRDSDEFAKPADEADADAFAGADRRNEPDAVEAVGDRHLK